MKIFLQGKLICIPWRGAKTIIVFVFLMSHRDIWIFFRGVSLNKHDREPSAGKSRIYKHTALLSNVKHSMQFKYLSANLRAVPVCKADEDKRDAARLSRNHRGFKNVSCISVHSLCVNSRILAARSIVHLRAWRWEITVGATTAAFPHLF